MKNPFIEMTEDQEVPAELKNRVMNSIYISTFIVDLADLFTVKYINTIEALFRIQGSKQEQPKSDLRK